MDSINDIISSLSSDDIEILKGVASSILGNQQSEEQQSSPTFSTAPKSNENSGNPLGLSMDDLNMILRAKGIFEKLNTQSSKNADLIMALKPHLSEENQSKADQAIKMLQLFEILPYLKELI